MIPIKARFWSKVLKTDNCWIWTAAHSHHGYGQFRFQGTMKSTHRVAWVFTYGEIPEGKQVLHHCDNRLCVKPDHLFLGTNHDNVMDREAKGRSYRGKARAKLTLEQVQQLFIDREQGMKVLGLASKYHVCESTIFRILSHKSFHYLSEKDWMPLSYKKARKLGFNYHYHE